MMNRCGLTLRVLAVVLLCLLVSGLRSGSAEALRISHTETSSSTASSMLSAGCNGSHAASHGGYVRYISFDESSGTVTYEFVIMYHACSNYYGKYGFTHFAITGPGGACPLAGWYGGVSGGAPAYDCVKYADTDELKGYRNCSGGGWGVNAVNTCIGGNIWSLVSRGSSASQPGTSTRTLTYRQTFTIPDWNTGQRRRDRDGSYQYVNSNICNFYRRKNEDGSTTYMPDSEWCQNVTATISWKHEWSLSGESYIGKDGRVSGSNSNARNRIQGTIKGIRPGATLYWDHWVRNDGPDGIPTTSNVQANINSERSAIGGSGQGSQQVVDSYLTNWKYVAPGTTFVNDHNEYLRKWRTVVNQDDVGQKVCQRVSWYWNSWNDARWAYSSPSACAEVPYHYPSCDDPNDPDCKDPYPYPSNPGGDCTYDGGCNPNVDLNNAVTVDVSTNGQETVMAGDDVHFTYNIRNDRGPTKTMGMGYKIYTFLYKGGEEVTPNPDTMDQNMVYDLSTNAGCYGRDVDGSNYVTVNGSIRCQQDGSGSGVVVSPGGSTSVNKTHTILNEWLGQPGDQICSYIVLDRYWNVYDNQPSGTQLASKIACVKIGKRPQVQLNGADSYANQGFTGSSFSNITLNHLRGSYSQYGLLTGNGKVSNFGSAGYTFSDPTGKSKACSLAWANSGSATGSCNGSSGLSAGRLTHTFYNALKATDTASYPGNLGSIPEGTHYYTASNLSISGSLGANRRVTIYVNGDVTITGNITAYGGSEANDNTTQFANLTDIPSLTIVATGDISVNGNVTRIDANLISTGGKFISCAGSESSGTRTELGIGSTKCSNKLKINGAVASKGSPILHRIFGAGNTIGVNQWDNNMNSTTSEWFNYTPNTWLTPYLDGTSGINGYTTVQVTNLPARY